METNKILTTIKGFALGLPDSQSDWLNIILEIEIQPYVFGISAHSILRNGKIAYLDPKFSSEVKQSILELHQKTIGSKGENKWNRLKFDFNRDETVEAFYEWDSIWQAEVDGYNKEAEEEDKNYKAPKWFWEEEELS